MSEMKEYRPLFLLPQRTKSSESASALETERTSSRSGMEMLPVPTSQTSWEGSTSSCHKHLLKQSFTNVSIILDFQPFFFISKLTIYAPFALAHEEHHAFEGGRSRR